VGNDGCTSKGSTRPHVGEAVPSQDPVDAGRDPAFREVLQWPVHRDAEPGTVWLRTLMAEVAGSMLEVSR
jgi:hypothetical protein